jgi:hypothetical protein
VAWLRGGGRGGHPARHRRGTSNISESTRQWRNLTTTTGLTRWRVSADLRADRVRQSLTSLARSRTSSRSPRTAGGAIQLEGTGCPCPPPRPALSGRQRRANLLLQTSLEPRLRVQTLDIHPLVVLVVTTFGPPPRWHRRPQLGRARLGDRRQRHHPPALKRRPRSGGRTGPARRASPARLTRTQPNPLLGGSS